MRDYELMLILEPQVEDKSVKATVDKLLKVVPADGGVVTSVDLWGRRRLAYEINKLDEGYYVVVQFTAPPATIQELDRQLGISEVVVRSKVTRPGVR